MKNLFYILTVLFLSSCTMDSVETTPEKEVLQSFDVGFKASEQINFFNGDTINFAFSDKRDAPVDYRNKVRAALTEVEVKLGCITFNEIFPADEVFDISTLNEGDVITTKGNLSLKIRQYTTPDHRNGEFQAFSGGLEVISDNQAILRFNPRKYNQDKLKIRYLYPDNNFPNGLVNNGIESYIISEYEHVYYSNFDIRLEKVRNERLSFVASDIARFIEGNDGYAFLGKQNEKSVFSQSIYSSTDATPELIERLITYTLGDEGSFESKPNYVFLKEKYCN